MATVKRKSAEAKTDQRMLEGADLFGALEGAPPELVLPSGLCAQFAPGTVKQAVDTTELTATFVIVTNEQNRHGNSHQITSTKLGQGLRTDLGFDANPVVLFDHGMSGNPFPVARSSKVKKASAQATAIAHFPERLKDLYPSNLAGADDCLRASAAVFAGIAEGLLTMSSIGFAPIKAMLRKQDAEEELPQGVERLDCYWRGLHFVETELREWSITAIGADRGALKQTLERGKIHDVRLPVFLRQSLTQAVEETEDEDTSTTVATGIDLSSLEEKIDGLATAVQTLVKRLPKRRRKSKPAEAQSSETPAEDEASTESTDGEQTPEEPVITENVATTQATNVAQASHNATIPTSEMSQEPDGDALVAAFRQRTTPAEPDLSQLAEALGGVIEQRVSGVAGRVEAVEQEFHRRLGKVG